MVEIDGSYAREAVKSYGLRPLWHGCLDRHMADQILVYMALAGPGSCLSVSDVTSHCKTNMWVIEQFLKGRFEVRHNSIRWTER